MTASPNEAASPHELIAEEVRALFARRRLSGRKAAQTLGWSEFYMSRRLTGRTPFDVNDLVAIAVLLDVPVMTFFEGLDPRNAASSRSVPSTSVNGRYWKSPETTRWSEAA